MSIFKMDDEISWDPGTSTINPPVPKLHALAYFMEILAISSQITEIERVQIIFILCGNSQVHVYNFVITVGIPQTLE